MRARVSALLVVAVLLTTGCSGRPALQDVEPAMTDVVRLVAGSDATVRRVVSARCGPGDERLGGLRLSLRADVPAGSVDLDDVTEALQRTALGVELGDGTDAPLLAVEAEDGWTADLWPGDDGTWWLTATSEVDGDPETAGGPVIPCG